MVDGYTDIDKRRRRVLGREETENREGPETGETFWVLDLFYP